jgi:hypothetical protein
MRPPPARSQITSFTPTIASTIASNGRITQSGNRAARRLPIKTPGQWLVGKIYGRVPEMTDRKGLRIANSRRIGNRYAIVSLIRRSSRRRMCSLWVSIRRVLLLPCQTFRAGLCCVDEHVTDTDQDYLDCECELNGACSSYDSNLSCVN